MTVSEEMYDDIEQLLEALDSDLAYQRWNLGYSLQSRREIIHAAITEQNRPAPKEERKEDPFEKQMWASMLEPAMKSRELDIARSISVANHCLAAYRTVFSKDGAE